MEGKELPINWVEVPFTQIFDANGGGQPPKSEFINEPKKGYIRLLQIRDFGDKPVPTFIPIKPNQRTCEADDILIARYGASIGRIVTGQKGSYNVALAKVKIPTLMNKKYVKGVLESSIFQSPILALQRTAQNGFNKNDLAEIFIPIPPRLEQDRIVAKIDTLMVQVETMQKSMKRIPQLLKDFRQQVLTQAVTGKLTEEWREGKELAIPLLENNKKYELAFTFEHPKAWAIYPIGNIFNFQQGMQIAKNTRLKEQRMNTLPILRIKNYHDGFIKDVEYVEITEKSLIADKDDIILTRTGESRGWVLTGFRGVIHNNTFRINFPKDKIKGKFIKIVLNSRQTQNFIKSNSGRTGQPDLSHKSFGPCPVIIPSLEEQKEIINRVESLFSKADLIEEKYKVLKTKIDTLPLGILHKAFKGELVEQLPTDGDARDLLREIERLKKN